jgi:predicted RNase H-like HicB family nuclease
LENQPLVVTPFAYRGRFQSGGAAKPPPRSAPNWPTWKRRKKLAAGIEGMGGTGKIALMQFIATLDRDEDGVWIAECPSIPGCVSQGESKEVALQNLQEAIALCLEVRSEQGLPLTIETRQIEVAT